MESGSWADWVAAIATVLGFGGALFQLRLSYNDSKRAREQEQQAELDRQQAMARAVGVKVEWQANDRGGVPDGYDGKMPVEVEVVNTGPYPIDGAVLKVCTDHEQYPMEIVYGTLLPGDRLVNTHLVDRTDVAFAELTSGASLVFTDAYGNHWERSPHGIEKLDQAARIC
ncbi:hypothetical protein [Nocardioides sp.]|uniref:hypothetical protein n=1 Tax=Nocardioides sp. TaxID=35761 RepID=UPI0035117DCA